MCEKQQTGCGVSLHGVFILCVVCGCIATYVWESRGEAKGPTHLFGPKAVDTVVYTHMYKIKWIPTLFLPHDFVIRIMSF